MPVQESRNLHGCSSLSPLSPILEDAVLQNISSWRLSAMEELMWLYFYFQPCHFREVQLWKVVLLENPVNGCSYRNVPLSSLVMNPMENCFQSSAIQTQTNLLCITTFFFYLLLHKLSTWPITLHACMPKAQCKTVELCFGSSHGVDCGEYLSKTLGRSCFSLQFSNLRNTWFWVSWVLEVQNSEAVPV